MRSLYPKAQASQHRRRQDCVTEFVKYAMISIHFAQTIGFGGCGEFLRRGVGKSPYKPEVGFTFVAVSSSDCASDALNTRKIE